jgi:hypothetical protein
VARIIQPGPEAASFNDDSSPDTRLTSGQKLSVNAQVVPESALDWFYRVLQLCESIPGELKSANVWERFRTLRGENKAHIWTGLSKVQIHIVDPRPYRKTFDEILKEIIPVDDPTAFLRQQLAAKAPFAIWLSMKSQVFTAERILDDSMASRVHSVSKFPYEGPVPTTEDIRRALNLNDKPLPIRREEIGQDGGDQVLSLSAFGPDMKPLVRKVSAWSAKSAATFHEALDCFVNSDEEMRWFPNEIIRKRMKTRVLDTHTFDKGDQKHLDLLESARGTILKNLGELEMGDDFEQGSEAKTETRPYSQTDSKDSYLVQAADIAAGIASKLLETENLVAVVKSFEYVTYNGRRLSVSEAEEETRRMR